MINTIIMYFKRDVNLIELFTLLIYYFQIPESLVLRFFENEPKSETKGSLSYSGFTID